MVGAKEHPHHMRDDQTDKADDTCCVNGKADHQRSHNQVEDAPAGQVGP